MTGQPDGIEIALRALRFRDRSAAELETRLEQHGVAETERERALEALVRIGYLDDERFARMRAQQLVDRASGNALIRNDLERRGLAADVIARALGALVPERERAERIVERRGRSAKTARYLASRGFEEEALEALVASED